MLAADFWQDKNLSKKIIKEKKLFEDLINSYENSKNKLSDLNDLYELAVEENNQNLKDEIYQNLKDLRILVKKNEIKCFLSEEADLFGLLYRNSCRSRWNRESRLGRYVKANVFKMV